MNTLVVEQFEQLIRQSTPADFIPFLLKLEKQDLPAAREKLKALKQELDTIVQLSANSWGTRATGDQHANLFLAGFAVYSRREALGGALSGAGSLGMSPNDRIAALKQHFITLVATLRPDWLHDWLLRQHDRASGWSIDYNLLRTLEATGLIPFSPLLTARSLPGLLADWGWNLSTTGSIPADAAAVIADAMGGDQLLLTRDLPLLFEYEGTIHHTWARIQPPMPLNQKGTGQGATYLRPWQAWDQLHPLQTVGWQALLLRLVANGHLDRADILTRCLLALRRDFRRPLLSWFRELFLALKPTFTERLARQAELTELLAHPLPLVVNFALDQLKDMHAEPGFNLAPLLLSAASLLTRPDLKTGLRSLVTGLARLPQRALAPAPTVAGLLTTALAHPDAAVQKLAAQGLAGLLSAPRPLLTSAEATAARAALAQQADYLSSAGRTILAPWLDAPAAAAPAACYTPLTAFVPDIAPATAIAPVTDWHELLFLTGQVLQHQDPAARERWLDGLLRLHGQLPADYAEQLRPYLVQVAARLKRSHGIKASDLLTESVSLHDHDGLFLALLLGWADGFATPRVARVDVGGSRAAPLLVVEQQRYLLVETRLQQAVTLSLLSTPTHQPHWVAPSALLARLLSHQAAGVAPAAADLALALARSAHAHPAEAAQARHLLPQLADAGLRTLLAWFFGPADQLLPALPPANERPPAQLATPVAKALPELWAVAARTKMPAASFPTLAASLGYDYAGVTQPLSCVGEAIPTPAQPAQGPAPRFAELLWRGGTALAAPSPLLLYASPVGQSQGITWENSWLVLYEFPYLAALLPNYPAPLYAHVLQLAAWTDNLESSERDLLLLGLHSLLGPGPVLETAATAVLASGLIHHTPAGRNLAQEVLLQTIAHGRLQPAGLGNILGHQLASGYAPASRLADTLRPLQAFDGLTDDALSLTLDALLPMLPATPPRNLRPLLDTYADLLARAQRPAPAALRPNLLAWQQAASLKPVAQPLLAQAA